MRDHVAVMEAEQRQVAERARAARLAKAKRRLARGRPRNPNCARGVGSKPVPGLGTPDAGADLGEDAAYLLDAWDSGGEGAGAKRRPQGCEAACWARLPWPQRGANTSHSEDCIHRPRFHLKEMPQLVVRAAPAQA